MYSTDLKSFDIAIVMGTIQRNGSLPYVVAYPRLDAGGATQPACIVCVKIFAAMPILIDHAHKF